MCGCSLQSADSGLRFRTCWPPKCQACDQLERAHARDRMRSLVAVIQIGRPSVRQQNVRPRPETEAHSGMCSTLKPSQNLDDQNRLLEISQPSHSTRETGGLSTVGGGVAQADGVRTAGKLSASWSLFHRAGLVTLITWACQEAGPLQVLNHRLAPAETR